MRVSHFETHFGYFRLTVFALAMMVCAPAQAVLPVYAYDLYSSGELINPQTSEIDLSMLSKLCVLSDPYQFKMTDYVAVKGVAESDNPDKTAQQIIQQSLQNIFDRHKSDFGGALTSMQSLNQNMKTQMGSQKNAVTVRFQPFSTKAEVAYAGELPVESSLSYVASQNEARFEITRKLTPSRTLAYTHVHDTDQQKDLIGIRWNF
jgi:hypothetical protein